MKAMDCIDPIGRVSSLVKGLKTKQALLSSYRVQTPSLMSGRLCQHQPPLLLLFSNQL